MSRTVIIGAGRSGLAAARYLLAQGEDVVLNDRRADPGRQMEAELAEMGLPGVWGRHPDSLFEDCGRIVLSPGVPADLPFLAAARGRGIPVLGELELAHRELRRCDPSARILAVTGTNGKSTTTDLAAHLLRQSGIPAAACGNLGMPLIEAFPAAAKGTVFVVECSSYQLETVETFHAEAAALLNLTPDHLARHGTMDRYLAAKQRIFLGQGFEDLRILPGAALHLGELAPGQGSLAVFGWGQPERDGAWCDDAGRLILRQGEALHQLLHRDELRIPGDHNVENALAAALLASHGGAFLEGLRAGLRSYPGLAHRIASCGEKTGIRAYNDSKGTNVDATLTAIRALPGPLVLLLGGQDKGTSYRPLLLDLQGKLRLAVFLGEAVPQLERDLGELPHRSIFPFDDAVHCALAAAQPGDQVLLSPACASFDQFENFEARGNRFEALVKEWMSA